MEGLFYTVLLCSVLVAVQGQLDGTDTGGTGTANDTGTATDTSTATDTGTGTANDTGTATDTGTGTANDTGTATDTSTATDTDTGGTGTNTGTDTGSTKTGTDTGTTEEPNIYCPMKCSYCWKPPSTTECRAFDMNGVVNPNFESTLTLVEKAFLALPHFKPNGEMLTCEGMRHYLRMWAALTPTIRSFVFRVLDSVSTGTLVTDGLSNFPKWIFSVIKPDVRVQIWRMMTDQQGVHVCRNIDAVLSCIAQQAILLGVDCFTVLMNSGISPTKDEVIAIAGNNCRSWSSEIRIFMLQHDAQSLSPTLFKSLDIAILLANVGSLPTDLSEDVVDIIAAKISTELRTGSVTDQDRAAATAFLVSRCYDPNQLLGILPATEIIEQCDMSKSSDTVTMEFVQARIADGTVDIQTMGPGPFASTFTGLTRDQLAQIVRVNRAMVETAACSYNLCGRYDRLSDAKKESIASAIWKEARDFFQDRTKAECFSCMMRYGPAAINADVIATLVAAGDTRTMDPANLEQARAIVDAVIDVHGVLDASSLFDAGPSILSIPVNTIPPNISMTADLRNLLDSSFRNAKRKRRNVPIAAGLEYARQIKAANSVNQVLQTSFASFVSPAELKLGFDKQGSYADLELTTKQALVIMKMVQEDLGSTAELTLDRARTYGPALRGLTKNGIKGIPNDASRGEILNEIADQRGSSNQRIVVYDEYKKYIGLDNTDAASLEAIRSMENLDVSGHILAEHSIDELQRYDPSVSTYIVDKLQDAISDERYLIKHKQEIFKFHAISIAKDDTSDPLTEADVDVGSVINGIAKRHIDRLTVEGVEKVLEKWYTRLFEDNQALVDRYFYLKGITTGGAVDLTIMMKLGAWIVYVRPNILVDIDRDIVRESAPSALKGLTEWSEARETRERNGFRSEIPAGDLARFEEKKMSYIEFVYDAILTASNTARRRRATESLACIDLQSLDTEGLLVLSTTHINNLADQDFIDCTQTLGIVNGYTVAQTTALLAVATRPAVYGDPSTWSTTTISMAGSICQAMSVTQIATLNITIDVASSLGQFSGWSTETKKAVFDRWLGLQKNDDSSTINADELKTLGDIICGAETSHINAIPTSVYESAADSIGEVTSCEASQYQAFAALAKVVYGSDVTAWDHTVIAIIGTTLGGLSASEISLLSDAQIYVVDPNHITYIPDAAFSGFTSDQILTSFSTAQAHATTQTQRDTLLPSQRSALNSVASMTLSTTTESGATTGRTTWPMTLLLVSLALFSVR